MTVVAIHQPNFFPWLGYFNKIIRSDIFIFLDDVQLPKKGGTWSNRVKLIVNDKSQWVTAALDRDFKGTRNINESNFLAQKYWREKMVKSIEASYSRHPYFTETMEYIEPLIMSSESNVANYNINAVSLIADRLGVNQKKIVRSSQYITSSSSNELLCTLTKLVGGDTYLCGGGANGYQNPLVFEQHNVQLQHQDFNHPVYPQMGSNNFVPGLSIIDVLMNIDIANTARMLGAAQQ